MSYKVAVPRVMGRVTNGQRAAVCGLVLAGVAYGYACYIVGIHPNMMARYLGADWRRKLLPPVWGRLPSSMACRCAVGDRCPDRNRPRSRSPAIDGRRARHLRADTTTSSAGSPASM